jgi:hypothetical protein
LLVKVLGKRMGNLHLEGVLHIVGMALLLDNLDMDPVLNLSKQRSVAKGCSAEGYRLWAKFFDSPGSSTFSPVPLPWKEFFIASLLNPSCFDWAKSFLSSDAWRIILSTNEQEFANSFVVPTKCPVKRKLECVCSKSMQEIEEITCRSYLKRCK